MGRYAEVAHKAAQAVEQQSDQWPCLNAGNNMLYVFLLEVRNAKLAHTEPSLAQSDNFLCSLKRALDRLKDHPLRVHDAQSAMGVPGIGASIAKLAAEELFAAYPPDPPTSEELEQVERTKAALKATEAAKRKRKADAEAASSRARHAADPPLAPHALRTTATAAPSGAAPSPTAETAGDAGAPSGRGAARKPRVPKPPKEYCPSIGTANYAFLLVLLQAQRGPERLEYLSKEQLVSRAESSGLSDKPIHADNPAQGQFNSRAFYSGWSSYKKLESEALTFSYSNPKKIQLTPRGLALAERLYRDAAARGKMAEIGGIPAEGAMLFQLEPAPHAAQAATAAAGAAAIAAARRQQHGQGDGAGGCVPIIDLAPSSEDEDSGSGGGRSGRRQPQRRSAGNGSEGGSGRAGGPGAGGEAALSRAAGAACVDALTRAAGTACAAVLTRAAGTARGAADGADVALDEAAAHLLEMGYSPRKSRKALRRSGGLLEALDIIELLSSDGEGGSDQEGPPASQPASHQPAARRAAPAQLNGAPDEPRVVPDVLPSRELSLPLLNTRPASQQGEQAALGHIRGGSQQGGARPRLGGSSQQSQHAQQGQHAQQATEPTSVARMMAAADRMLAALAPRGASVGAAHGQQQQRRREQQPQPPAQRLHDQQQEQQGPRQQPPTQQPVGRHPGLWLSRDDVRLPPLPPGTPFCEVYEVVLLVDGREQYSRYTGAGSAGQGRSAALETHIARMRGCGLAVEHRTLPVGDALWVARGRRDPGAEFVLDYVLERKSVSDLLASIKSSERYATQKYSLQRCGLRHLYYLVEGDPEVLPSLVDQKIVRSAAASTEVVDGFRVLRTAGVQETFRLYQALTEAIAALYCGLTAAVPRRSAAPGAQSRAPQPGLPTLDEFKAHVREVGPGSTTLHDAWGRMLGEVPGLGPDGVAAVLSSYPTPASLWRAYRDAQRAGGAAAAEALLVGARGTASGRALGAERAARVFRTLFR